MEKVQGKVASECTMIVKNSPYTLQIWSGHENPWSVALYTWIGVLEARVEEVEVQVIP